MNRYHAQGGASASPAFRAFLAIGGRVSVGPAGELATSLDMERLFSASAAEARRGFTIGRRFHRRLRDPRFSRAVMSLVLMDGEGSASGWIVAQEAAR